MKKKKVQKIALFGIYLLLGTLCLLGGILYAKFEKGGLAATIPGPIRSQVITENTQPETEKQKITLTPEKIKARMETLEGEIVQETNDPERALELRRQLQELKEQLPVQQ